VHAEPPSKNAAVEYAGRGPRCKNYRGVTRDEVSARQLAAKGPIDAHGNERTRDGGDAVHVGNLSVGIEDGNQ
jgi:hypothetical protein